MPNSNPMHSSRDYKGDNFCHSAHRWASAGIYKDESGASECPLSVTFQFKELYTFKALKSLAKYAYPKVQPPILEQLSKIETILRFLKNHVFSAI